MSRAPASASRATVEDAQPAGVRRGRRAEQPELGPAGLDRLDHVLGGEGRIGRDGHGRMCGGEVADQGRQRLHAGAGHRDQLHPAAGEPPGGPGRGLRGLQVADHLAGRLDQLGAGVAEHDAAADPVEQRHTELALERPDRLGQRRLRDVELLRSAAEVHGLDDGEEIGQLPDVHRATSCGPIGRTYR
jgi:hypothetical protein